MTPTVITSVNRTTQQVLQCDPVGTVPFELAPVGTRVRPDRHANPVLDQITQDALDGPHPIEYIEYHMDDTLDLLVRVQRKYSRWQLHVPGGRVVIHLAAPRFIEQPLVHATSQYM